MPTLTLTLPQGIVSTHSLTTSRLVIGSHPECDLRIDSLAVASRHVELIETEDGYRLQALDPEYRVSANGQDPGDRPLRHGDSFQVGAYRIFYGEAAQGLPVLEPEADADMKVQPPIPNPTLPPPPPPEGPGVAYLQILNGPRIGRLLLIDQPQMRLTRGERGDIILTREGDRYLLDARRATTRVLVDGAPVGEEPVSLDDGQEIQIGHLRLWFFAP